MIYSSREGNFSQSQAKERLRGVVAGNKLKELKLVKKKIRIVSMLLTVVLLMSAFVTPVAAGRGSGRGQERGQGRQGEQIQYLDAEVRVIDGQPVLRYEAEDGYADIPFDLPAYVISADGQRVAVQRHGDAILLPTEDGFEAVPLKDFSVVMMNGQIMLLAEVNPIWKLIPVAIGKATMAMLKSAFAAAGLNGFTFSFHFVERFVLRLLSSADVITVIRTGQRSFWDPVRDTRVIYHSGLRMAIVVDRNTRHLITVMDEVNLSSKLRAGTWIRRTWNW
mgnify:CR=1 FL=1